MKGECRLCGESEPQVKLTRHHLMPVRMMRRKGGTLPTPLVLHLDNVVKLCVKHHRAIERGILRGQLRMALTDAERYHVISVAGRVWLEQEYPHPGLSAHRRW